MTGLNFITLALLLTATGQSPAPATKEPPGRLEAITGLFKDLGDWGDEAELISHQIDKVWAENEWNSEADQFARDLSESVFRIPPWDVNGRLNKLGDMVQERYRLDDNQRRTFSAATQRELFGFIGRNAEVFAKQIREQVGARVKGEPFTAEQIAEWMREAGPLMKDAYKTLDHVIQEMGQSLTPGQKEILGRDLESYGKRKAFFDHMMTEWAEGRWQPEHWGLENDPVQQGEGKEDPNADGAQGSSSRPSFLDYDETTWEAYVADFIARYRLDPAQQRTARSILSELVDRADQYREPRKRELSAIPLSERPTDARLDPIRTMFQELEARFARIPTQAQLNQAPDPNPSRQ